jgi:hypothetical protein
LQRCCDSLTTVERLLEAHRVADGI